MACLFPKNKRKIIIVIPYRVSRNKQHSYKNKVFRCEMENLTFFLVLIWKLCLFCKCINLSLLTNLLKGSNKENRNNFMMDRDGCEKTVSKLLNKPGKTQFSLIGNLHIIWHNFRFKFQMNLTWLRVTFPVISRCLILLLQIYIDQNILIYVCNRVRISFNYFCYISLFHKYVLKFLALVDQISKPEHHRYFT